MSGTDSSKNIAEMFGKNLRRERVRAGISQDNLAIRAELHRTEVSQLERGLRVPRISTLVRLTGSLGVSAGDLLNGIEWKPGTRSRGKIHMNRSGSGVPD